MQSCNGTGMALVGIILIYTCFAVEFIRQTLEQLIMFDKHKSIESTFQHGHIDLLDKRCLLRFLPKMRWSHCLGIHCRLQTLRLSYYVMDELTQ